MMARLNRGADQRLPHRRIEGAAVEEEVLADDEPGGGSAQKRAGVAELGGVADPAGWV